MLWIPKFQILDSRFIPIRIGISKVCFYRAIHVFFDADVGGSKSERFELFYLTKGRLEFLEGSVEWQDLEGHRK